MRQMKSPQTYAHLKRDFDAAVKNVCHSRNIQRSFMRAYSRDANGDKDESLIPKEILDWYSDSNNDGLH